MIRFLLCALTALSAFSLHAKDFSSWTKFSSGELVPETTSLSPGSAGTVGLRIKLAPHWHTYWSNPGDSGTAIRLDFKNSHGLRVRKVLMPRPQRFMTGPLISFGYADEVLFLIDVDVSASAKIGESAEFEVDAEWLVCEDVCIPAFQTFKLSLPLTSLDKVQPSAHFALFQKTRALVPQERPDYPKYEFEGETVTLKISDWDEREFVDFFPFRNSGVTNKKAEAAVEGDALVLKLTKSEVAADKPERVGVLVARNPRTKQMESWQFGDSGWTFSEAGGEATSAKNPFWMMLFAFVGGLILNLMPCVFPILSIKLLSLLKLGASHASEVRRQNLAYVAGVLVSFLFIALLLSALRSAGTLVGWGFQLQSPVFLSLLSWLFFALSLNLLGVFEIDFLNANMGSKWTRLHGWAGSFFTGVLAVVVASPCTAPFMGVALGFGLTQSTLILVGIFLCLGLGLAFPYLLFAIFPRAIRVLPRPGAWMNTVKQVMAIPLLLTTLWLLWILGQVRGINGVIAVLAGCIAIGVALILTRKGKVAAQAVAALVVVGGLVHIWRAEQVVMSEVESSVWKPFSENLMESLKGQRVFVNMTADWCLTCKVNERLVFNDPDVMKLLEAKKVVLVKGDWTRRNEEITRFLTRFDRVGVPFYVLYSPRHPQGQILPEVLSKSTFMELVQQEFPDGQGEQQ